MGRTIHVDGKRQGIIGVMPPTFRFLDEPNPDLILPFKFDRAHT
jgi:hypothetical protein